MGAAGLVSGLAYGVCSTHRTETRCPYNRKFGGLRLASYRDLHDQNLLRHLLGFFLVEGDANESVLSGLGTKEDGTRNCTYVNLHLVIRYTEAPDEVVRNAEKTDRPH